MQIPYLQRAIQPGQAPTRARGEIRDGLATADDHTAGAAVWNVAAFVLDLGVARGLARLLTDRTRSPSVRALGHLDPAHIELALGRWREAGEALDCH